MVILTNPDKHTLSVPRPDIRRQLRATFEAVAHDPEFAGGGAAGMHWLAGSQVPGKHCFLPQMGGLVSVLFRAYSEHYALTLTPDDFWTAVVTQLSFYVNARAEKLRERLVDHEGQIDLEVAMGGSLATCKYDQFVEKLIPLIDKNLKSDLAEWFVPDFSTTTPDIKVSLGVALMATTQKYFTFTCNLRCGLPQVKLLGTVEDWEKLRDHVQKLRSLTTDDGTMEAWLKMLEPIFDELVKTARGEDNFEWWQTVAHSTGGGSGPTYNDGWSAAFTAFTTKGAFRKASPSGYPKIDTNLFAPGVVMVPVRILDDREYHASMFSGCLAAHVDMNTEYPTLRPITAWSIAIPEDEWAAAETGAARPAAPAEAEVNGGLHYRGGVY